MYTINNAENLSRTERQTSPVDLIYKMWDPRNVFLGAWGPSKPKVIPEDVPYPPMLFAPTHQVVVANGKDVNLGSCYRPGTSLERWVLYFLQHEGRGAQMRMQAYRSLVRYQDIGEKTLRFYESEDLKYTIIRIREERN
ncbi:hypothetical protein GUITHDRAFT_139312 [Guillardia theta CCMP2712]|uniref:Uncharacterized protein n=1 Tax=Guillardia theta (strain CCMP2712) TaxID=905079 RepID=L1J931_GUITC|nr:hypothetical protein GUITHDRAFT_139312 [Guillardia theta CCMP2712]EKX45036.1 hypothetical protein GUITHDRAFT_139312 [Guillardia theta CCMP2712]|eukprot:XP_005832016.1 hypothetical protein GUITHDRAFT_139312 [Guillardia theta CCMP2712]